MSLAVVDKMINWEFGSFYIQYFDIPMHPNMSREAPPHPSHRDRPLQKSMFLPETHSHQLLPPRQSPPLQAFLYSGLKRTPPNDSLQLNPPFAYNQTYPLPGYPQPVNAGQYLPERPQSQHELLHLGNSSSLKNLGSTGRSDLSGEAEGRGFARLEKQGGYEGRTSLHVAEGGEGQELLQVLKEKHLPGLLNSLKKEIYEDINSIRVEFQSLREEMKSQNGRQDAINAELRSLAGANGGREKKADISELQTHFFLLEGKLSQMEAKLNDNYQKFTAELQKTTLKFETEFKGSGFKAGAIRSSLSPILLEYRQIFSLKRPNEVKPRNEEEMVISSCQYHIDRQGYLLDSDNRYLIDARGAQIRLDERHLRLLENWKILQR